MAGGSVESAQLGVGFFLSGSDFTGGQYRFVKHSAVANETVLEATAATDQLAGVIQNKPNVGDVAHVAIAGVTKLTAGAAIVRGDQLTSDAQGRAIPATGNVNAGAVAHQSASGAGVIITATVLPYALALAALDANVLLAVNAGKKQAWSAAPVAVTGTLDVNTGLATVESFTATLAEDAALTGDNVTWVAGAAGHVTLKVWKRTGAGDCTPIAATAAKNVSWMAAGT